MVDETPPGKRTAPWSPSDYVTHVRGLRTWAMGRDRTHERVASRKSRQQRALEIVRVRLDRGRRDLLRGRRREFQRARRQRPAAVPNRESEAAARQGAPPAKQTPDGRGFEGPARDLGLTNEQPFPGCLVGRQDPAVRITQVISSDPSPLGRGAPLPPLRSRRRTRRPGAGRRRRSLRGRPSCRPRSGKNACAARGDHFSFARPFRLSSCTMRSRMRFSQPSSVGS
jgi:hypothetical protein